MDGRNKNQKDLVISILLAAYTHTRKNVIIYFADLTCIISNATQYRIAGQEYKTLTFLST